MLTKDLSIVRYDFANQVVLPDRLTTGSHGHYLALAERMLAIYREGARTTRRDLHRRIQGLFDEEAECPQRRIDAFCKLLDDEAEYATASRRNAPALRRRVFRLAAEYHPLVTRADRLFEHCVGDVQEKISRELARPWSEIEAELYSDILEFHRLERFRGPADGRGLLSRYNVAQVQAALYSAVSLDLRITRDFQRSLRGIRLSGLMHTIERTAPGVYQIRLDGPASVLRETRRYGVSMARFLPVLIACRGWRMCAEVETRFRRKLRLELSEADRLQSHLGPEGEFDSGLETEFAGSWGHLPRDGWTLHREGEFLHSGQKTFVPDFLFRHADSRVVYLEIVGFWTPEYIQSRQATHAVFANVPILLAIPEHRRHQFASCGDPLRVILYKKSLPVTSVVEALSRCG